MKIPNEAHLNTGPTMGPTTGTTGGYARGHGGNDMNSCLNIECKYGYEIKCGVNENCYERGKDALLGWTNKTPSGIKYLQGSNANCEGWC